MTKREMMKAVAKKGGMTVNEAKRATDALLKTLMDELQANGKVTVAGFGTFEVRKRKGRIGRNPRTNEAVEIPAGKLAAFKAGKLLKEKLNS